MHKEDYYCSGDIYRHLVPGGNSDEVDRLDSPNFASIRTQSAPKNNKGLTANPVSPCILVAAQGFEPRTRGL